jgi:hypothetical protein
LKRHFWEDRSGSDNCFYRRFLKAPAGDGFAARHRALELGPEQFEVDHPSSDGDRV